MTRRFAAAAVAFGIAAPAGSTVGFHAPAQVERRTPTTQFDEHRPVRGLHG